MAFTRRLKERAAELWERELEHPFVRGIGRGDLEEGKFRFYLCQDYLFLLDYCRVFALGVSRSENEEQMGFFESLLHSTLTMEMDLHRQYAREFGITPERMEASEYHPATLAYTRHLLWAAQSERPAGLLSALLPCSLGYWEIGRGLKERGLPENPLYRDWIEMYSSEEFGRLARRMTKWTDRLCRQLPERELRRFEKLFIASVRCEIGFWEMGWNYEPGGEGDVQGSQLPDT